MGGGDHFGPKMAKMYGFEPAWTFLQGTRAYLWVPGHTWGYPGITAGAQEYSGIPGVSRVPRHTG